MIASARSNSSSARPRSSVTTSGRQSRVSGNHWRTRTGSPPAAAAAPGAAAGQAEHCRRSLIAWVRLPASRRLTAGSRQTDKDPEDDQHAHRIFPRSPRTSDQTKPTTNAERTRKAQTPRPGRTPPAGWSQTRACFSG